MALHFRDQLNESFQKKEWVAERIGWVIIVFILVAAILGLFGGGLFTATTARSTSDESDLSLTYARWGRMESPMDFRLKVSAPQQTAAEVSIKLNGDLLSKIEVKSVLPEPDSTSFDEGAIVYTWQVEDWSSPLLVTVNYRATEWRGLTGDVQVLADEAPLGSLKINEFIFP